MFKVNTLGVVYSIEAVLPDMLKRGQGHLAAVSSMAAFLGMPGESGYCASKAAVNMYMHGLRLQLRNRGIHVSTICPGFIETPMTAHNKFKMPWVMSAARAAQKIVGALERRKKVYCFPWQMNLLMTIARFMPDWVIEWALRRQGGAEGGTVTPLAHRDRIKTECRPRRCYRITASRLPISTRSRAMPRPLIAMMMLLLFSPPSLLAQSQAKKDEPLDKLAQAFKPVLIKVIPKTLHEKTENWDHQVMVPVGLKWSGIRPRVTKSLRNHGEWRKLIVETRDLPGTLELKVYDVKTINPEKQTFKVFLGFQMGVEYEQQNWESGARLWSGSVRARAHVKVDLECENTLRVEFDKKTNLPDFILRLKVTGAKLDYDTLVFEHVPGLGGDAAKLIGKAAHNAFKKWRPNMERDLLAKASDSIVKAADTREIRLSLGGLVKAQ